MLSPVLGAKLLCIRGALSFGGNSLGDGIYKEINIFLPCKIARTNAERSQG